MNGATKTTGKIPAIPERAGMNIHAIPIQIRDSPMKISNEPSSNRDPYL
jgi:hypothetical protein